MQVTNSPQCDSCGSYKVEIYQILNLTPKKIKRDDYK